MEPTTDEFRQAFRKLTHWQAVGFAGLCAHLVLPMFKKVCPKAVEEYAILEAAILLAERSACNCEVEEGTRQAADDARAIAARLGPPLGPRDRTDPRSTILQRLPGEVALAAHHAVKSTYTDQECAHNAVLCAWAAGQDGGVSSIRFQMKDCFQKLLDHLERGELPDKKGLWPEFFGRIREWK
jgi:hypothetical protein